MTAVRSSYVRNMTHGSHVVMWAQHRHTNEVRRCLTRSFCCLPETCGRVPKRFWPKRKSWRTPTLSRRCAKSLQATSGWPSGSKKRPAGRRAAPRAAPGGGGCLAFAESLAGRESITPGIRHPHLGGIDPLAAGPHFLACHRHKATLHERRDRADAKAMRGQKRLRRPVGARSGDYSECMTLLGTERHW